MTWAGDGLIVLGALTLFIAACGLFVLKDALSRQHAVTNAGTLGLALMAAGVAVVGGGLPWVWRSVVLVLAVWATMPVASHLLARTALREHIAAKSSHIIPFYKRDEPGKSKVS